MRLLHFSPISLLFALVLWGQGTSPAKPSRIYVEPFKTTSESEKLHALVISELHKTGITVDATDRAGDVVLGGGGEIWIKGYKSLNPRSGRLPSDGSPVYDGYLAVELRDSGGQTFWSYLVTPGAESQDVAKDLARRIAKQVSEAIKLGEPARYSVVPSNPATVLKGAGATFPQPVYEKWFHNYRRENPNLEIEYQPIGSEAGIRSLLAGNVDFGATDNPAALKDMAPNQQSHYLLIPSIVGAVVPIVNLPGVSGTVALTPDALAGIYLGTIRKWNDPLLVKSNRGLHLPDLDITVVHRADGSGTSYAFTDFLSKTNDAWRNQVGARLNPSWPVGKSANGNDGVAKMVKEFGGAIGYVEFIYALQNHMSFAKVRNRSGEFVSASLEGMAIAASEAAKENGDWDQSIVNAPGSGAYPISSFTWLVVPTQASNPARLEAMKDFLKWMLKPGQTQAAALGYLALPKDVLAKAEATLTKLN